MARMFPENGPAKTTSKAEKRIYTLLAETLGDDYAVFHGLHWETRERDDQLAKRESDFLIISRTHGLLILEAKGGHIRRGDAAGTYFTKASSGRRAKRPTRDPFEQARSLVPLLERHLWTAPLTLSFAPAYRIGHGVWFPDTAWRRGARTAADDDIVLDRLDLDAPEAGLLRVYAHFERARGVPAPLGDEALVALYETLAPTVLVQSRLAVQIEGEERRIQELTAEQFAILQALGRYRRLAVSGAAGTGKTVLAYEKARRLATQGLDVLLLCSNPSLARWLDARATLEPAELRPHLMVHDIDALCAWVLTLAGTMKDTKDGGQETGESEQAAALAELLRTAIRALERRGERMPFDAILVDEAQDLDRPLWEPLLALLRDRANGLCYVFYDEAQREGDGGWRLPLPADTAGEKPLLPLVVNLRNTWAIFDVMMRFYHGPDAPICHGPVGRAPMYLDPASLPAPPVSEAGSPDGDAPAGGDGPALGAGDGDGPALGADDGDGPALGADDGEVIALRLALDHLIGAEGILPEEILVITCRSQRRSRWYTAQNRRIGTHRLIQRPEGGRPGRVALSTVRSAKGLERKVVILTELDGLEGAARRDALLYVALSRAVHHLVVLGPEKALQPRKQGVLTLIRGSR